MPALKERNVATFDGWYSDPNFTNRVTEIPSGSKGAKTFYAKWKYNFEIGKFFACGEKLIVKKDSDSDTIVRAYFDEVNPDNAVLNDDGGLLNIYNWEVYGSKKDGTYPEGTTDDITVESGSLIAVYANGENGIVTVNDGDILQVKTEGHHVTVNVNGGKIAGDYANRTAIYTGNDEDATINITGGTITGNIRSGVATNTLIKVSGAPVIGNGKDIGIDLSSARDNRIYAGNLNNAATESITLLAPSANDGTIMATFANGATAFKDSFVIMNEKRKRVVEVVGQDIKVVGGLSLPNEFVEKAENTYALEHGNITIAGTIFSVFAEGGYFTLTKTELADNVHFDMGIPVDAAGKEKQFVYDATEGEYYRYIQFTSENGLISPNAADDFLTSIEFHKINNKPIKIRINLETVPITGDGYQLNQDVFYLDGSFYKKSNYFEKGTDKPWATAYKEAKAMKFNGLPGYLMTITSDAENKFVYDQVFKGMNADDVGSWIGGTRQTSSKGYDATTWASNGYNKYWTWACGPESGKTFYTNTFARKDVSYRADGMYSSWSNPEDCALNGIPRAYNDDFEPNNQGNGNYTGGDNSNENKEFYTQYTGRYVWNDAKDGTGTQKRWQVHYYVVEFTPYENKVTGEKYVSTAPRLHAEQEYE